MSEQASIRSIHEMTPTVKQFELELEDGSWDFRPGQHTVIRFEQDGEEVVRPYTPTTLPGTDRFALAIKEYEGGTASVYMHEREPEDVITVDKPDGDLYIRNYDEDVVFVSTGTGITPMIAMLKDYLRRGKGQVYFFFGEKTQDHLMYRETLDQLEAENDALTVVYSLSDEEWSGREGFVQEHLPDELGSLEGYDFYVCGVPQMVVDTKELLAEHDVPDDRIFSEGWEEDAAGD
jgi:ferredoxin-NADP reductase